MESGEQLDLNQLVTAENDRATSSIVIEILG